MLQELIEDLVMGPLVAFGTVLMEDKSQRFQKKVPTSLAESSSDWGIRGWGGSIGTLESNLLNLYKKHKDPEWRRAQLQATQLVRAGPRGGPWLPLPAWLSSTKLALPDLFAIVKESG